MYKKHVPNRVARKIAIHLFYLILLLLKFGDICAQSASWETAGVLYRDGYVTVTLEYRVNSKICDPGSTKKSFWRYIVEGKGRGSDLYLNWKMDYLNCNGNVICLTNNLNIGKFENDGKNESLDWSFEGATIENEFYDVKTSSYPDLTKPFEKRVMPSVAPTSISGDRNVVYGQSLSLSVQGGSLGSGAKWVWYADKCDGNKIGEGATISVQPLQNTIYYVRAEGKTGVTACASVKVNVDLNSQAATRINGPASICQGQGAKLRVEGGLLGLNANWYWYQDSCGGKQIGEGASIVVYPNRETTYFVRAKGQTNTTVCRSYTVKLESAYANPTGIESSTTLTCPGIPIQLKVVGGEISDKAQWVWYRGSLNYSPVGYGRTITLDATTTTTYYVRGEGGCPATTPLQQEVKVYENSSAPRDISAELVNRKYRLSPIGGSLGDSAEWTWYKNSISNNNRIGQGSTIVTKVTKNTRVLLRAEGICNVTDSVSYLLTPPPKRYLFLNLGLIGTSPSDLTSFGNLAITLATKKKMGWYVRAKLHLSAKPEAKYITDDEQVYGYQSTTAYYKYNGEKNVNRMSATGGMLLGNNRISGYIGAGYGTRDLYWGITEYTLQGKNKVGSYWAQHIGSSVKGIEAEGGLMINLGHVNLMGGVSYINDSENKTHLIDSHIGIGVTL
ncbi:hypothetical protein OCK74_19955 [Chitinophagaceae bacterium LB-8]|uniref:Ig-like domain-containing protein n=1 Tax=Paraflavisolibacter caeni TaxID=2982496 RepID=A0A9X3BII1_9BACT|nr:hypothetical protein [Paraflavisolibacter caeni]MCU7551407.1 hypothetical protein [Paraflavisolibacter caeni]